jgi:hypothetical protein
MSHNICTNLREIWSASSKFERETYRHTCEEHGDLISLFFFPKKESWFKRLIPKTTEEQKSSQLLNKCCSPISVTSTADILSFRFVSSKCGYNIPALLVVYHCLLLTELKHNHCYLNRCGMSLKKYFDAILLSIPRIRDSLPHKISIVILAVLVFCFFNRQREV